MWLSIFLLPKEKEVLGAYRCAFLKSSDNEEIEDGMPYVKSCYTHQMQSVQRIASNYAFVMAILLVPAQLFTRTETTACTPAINGSSDESIGGQSEAIVSSPMDMDTNIEDPSATYANGAPLDKLNLWLLTLLQMQLPTWSLIQLFFEYITQGSQLLTIQQFAVAFYKTIDESFVSRGVKRLLVRCINAYPTEKLKYSNVDGIFQYLRICLLTD